MSEQQVAVTNVYNNDSNRWLSLMAIIPHDDDNIPWMMMVFGWGKGGAWWWMTGLPLFSSLSLLLPPVLVGEPVLDAPNDDALLS